VNCCFSLFTAYRY